MRVKHPPDWEVAAASGPQDPGRVIFADRDYHRLDLKWRPLKYVPDLDLGLEKHRRKSGDTEIQALTGAPSEWRGVLRQTPDASIVHAGRFFKETRLLAEIVLVWPSRRNTALENEILESVRPEPPEAPVRTWQAMGISLTLDGQFDLHESIAKVGRVTWQFAVAGGKGPLLTVERIAMPDYWLKDSLRDWLVKELPQGQKPFRQDAAIYNRHPGQQLIAHGKLGITSALRGLKRVRLDLAWKCPVEGRLYRISLSQASCDLEAALPGHFKVQCCRPVPAAVVS